MTTIAVGLAAVACGGDGPSGTPSAAGGMGADDPAQSANGFVVCQELCETAEEACGQPIAACADDCAALRTTPGCRNQVDALILCQRDTTGSCDADGDYVVDGCGTEARAAATCLSAAISNGSDLSNDSDAPEDQDRQTVPSSDAIDMIVQACEGLCGACLHSNCTDSCRVNGARHLDCLQEYLTAVRCAQAEPLCNILGESCVEEFDALRACWVPTPRVGTLTCMEACEARREPNCPGENAYEPCTEACAKAVPKPDCSEVVAAYTSCSAASRDICVPANGALWTECREETAALSKCASPIP